MPFQQFAFCRARASTLATPLHRIRIQTVAVTMRTTLTFLGLYVAVSTLAVPGRAQSPAGMPPASAPPTSTVNASARERENHDPLLDLPLLPHGQVTLIGGTVSSLDQVMNRMVVQPFGGKQKMRVRFDIRTHFYRDGKPVAQRELRQGQRIYLDTMLNGDKVFAKTIWIRTSAENGTGRGQITEIDQQRKTLTVRDELSNQPVKLQMTPTMTIRRGDQPASVNDLVEGALVSLAFGPQKELREITLLATPGSVFSFAGRVTYVDLSRKLIAIDNHSDGKNYDVYMDAVAPNILRQLREGAAVNVSAVFDGSRYTARQVDLPASSAQQSR